MPHFIDIDKSFGLCPVTGDVRASDDNSSIKQSIVGLVLSSFSSRPFEPEYRSPIADMEFKQYGGVNSLSSYMISSIIGSVINNHEPRVRFLGCDVDNTSNLNRIRVNIKYQIITNPEMENQLEVTI